MLVSVIIVAAGSGSRLGANVPKAFVKVGEATLLENTLRTVATIDTVGEIVIATPPGMEPPTHNLARAAQLTRPVKVVAGGAERQDSVRIALQLTSVEAEVVIIHDAARPFATPAMFEASIARASECGAAIVAMPLADTLKRVADRLIRETIPRADLWQAQTPQAFRRDLIIKAHDRALREGIMATDDADLVERMGVEVAVVAGSPTNLKITTADDFKLAQAIVLAQNARD